MFLLWNIINYRLEWIYDFAICIIIYTGISRPNKSLQIAKNGLLNFVIKNIKWSSNTSNNI